MTTELSDFLKEKRLTFELLNELLDYNCITGELTWKLTYFGAIIKGKVAGTKTKGKKGGYITIEINGKAYKAHRLAWCLYEKKMPPEDMVVDHKDRIRSNNKIDNLRLLSEKHNSQNKTRKHKLPLYIYKHRDKFAVRITTDKFRHFGSFKTVDEALIKRNLVLTESGLTILEAA